MESEQMTGKMMGCLIEQITAKVEANTNTWQEGNKACREAMEACLEKVKTEIYANRKEMKSLKEETKAYPEKREVNPEQIKSIMVHEEVLEEEAAVKTGRALKKRYGD
jgi:hypothetical protein